MNKEKSGPKNFWSLSYPPKNYNNFEENLEFF